jgi:hypothetical protein
MRYVGYQTITNIPNGIYKIGAMMRASGTPGAEGVYLFGLDGQVGTQQLVDEEGVSTDYVTLPGAVYAPAHIQPTNWTEVTRMLNGESGTEYAEDGTDSIGYYTDSYGPIWYKAAVACLTSETGSGTEEEEAIYNANSQKGRGWFYVDATVTVTNNALTIGVTNDSILTAGCTDTTGAPCVPFSGNWFSADNFTLTLVETIPTYEVDLAEPQNGAIEVSAAVAAEGDKVVITATPNEGYELESVSVKGVTSDIAVQVVTDEVTGEMSFTMPKDAVEVSATFKEIAYPITYAIGMQNGTVEGPVESVAGEKVTLTVTPAEGYELENLTITCVESQNEINYDVVDYSFTMPKEGVYIIATFVQTTGIDAASAAKGKKIGVKKYFKNGELIIIGKDGKEFRANGAAK